MNFTDISNIGKSYKDFILLSIDDLPDLKGKGIFLRHKRTGLEVYHIYRNDKENLFSFAFRTVAKDSLGTAHIMEHSTLCGSEKYPLKEPFNTLDSTSLNTFLNALTYPDKTVYPAASVIRADYFNMFDVYADCVFFPKLDYTTFIQEGHRLELDENGKVSIQGVVYNEMKGSYSTFSPIAYSNLVSAMFPDSYPAFDSGGDPVNIPDLTYEQFLEFHQKFYNPDNCLLFLYGDIPTGEQLDYFSEHFISRIEQKYGFQEEVPYAYDTLPHIKQEIKDLMVLKKNQKSMDIHDFGPEEGSTGSMVTISWYTGQSNLEKMFLTEVLNGNDSSPVSNILKSSELGDDVICGNFGQYNEEFYVMGISGVEKNDEGKVYDLVLKTVKDIAENGVEQEDIDAALMGMDFNLREENRYFGPPSIDIMERTLKCWCHGKKCDTRLNLFRDFDVIKEKLKNDKDFTKKLMKKYFIENPISIKFICEPSSDYFAERNKKEEELISELEKDLDKEKLQKELDALHAYQQKVETPEETACIPSTDIKTLDSNIDFPRTNLEFLPGDKNQETGEYVDVPFFVSEEETKGIFYLDFLFPFDNLDPEYIPKISLMPQILTNMGWNGKKWEDCISEAACITGDVWGRYFPCEIPSNPVFAKNLENYKKYNFVNRHWFGVSCKALTEKAEETLNLMNEIITKMDFEDLKRFQSILTEVKADRKAACISMARNMTYKRVRAELSVNNAMSEIFNGVTDYMNVYNLDCDDMEKLKELLQIYKKIYYECLNQGVIIHITADKDSLAKLRPLMAEFTKACQFKKLSEPGNITLDMILPYIYKGEIVSGAFAEQDIKTKSQTGFTACLTKASPAFTIESAAENVYTSWFANHTLWDKIRTTGGAYGAYAGVNGNDEYCIMSSYRDPSPENTPKVIKQALKEISEIDISPEDIEKTIVSCFGDKIVPITARERGSRSFDDFMHGMTPEDRQKNVDLLLKVTPEEVKKASKRFAAWSDEFYRVSIFCDNSVQTCGNNIDIPL